MKRRRLARTLTLTRMHAKAGLSLAEVLVVLVISSLILSIVLPLAGRSVADNLRIGVYGLNSQDLSLREESYRRLLRSARQPRAQAGGNQSADTLSGQSDAFSVTVLSLQDNACAPAGRLAAIELRIVRTGQDQVLQCSGDGRSQDLLRLDGAVSAEFLYSIDGREWFDHWPLEDSAEQRLVVDAPLVSLVAGAFSRPIVWVERAGRPMPVNFNLQPSGEGPTDVRRDGIVVP